MANNYIEGSISFPLPPAALQYASELYDRICNGELTPEDKKELNWDDDYDGLGGYQPFQLEVGDTELAIWEEEGFPANLIACFVQYLLRQFNLDQFVLITWAEYCSKPRPDEFGGGAVFVCKDAIEFLDQDIWVEGCKKKHGIK